MPKNLTTRSKFADLCGVTPAAVTTACKTSLKDACDGRRIDQNHPAAQAYLQEKTAPRPERPADGIDGRYQEAIDACREAERWSTTYIQKALGVGYGRAKRMFDTMILTGVYAPPDALDAPPKPKAAPHRRGKQAAKDTKKRAAWQEAPAGQQDIVEVPEDIQAFADLTLRELIERFGTDIRFLDWLSATQKIEAINEKRLKNAETEGRLISRQLVKSAVLDRVDGVFVRMLTDGAKTIASRAHSMAQAGEPVASVRAMVEDQLGSFIRPAKVKMREALRGNEED